MFCDDTGSAEHCLICHKLIPRGLSSFDNNENDKSVGNGSSRRWSGCSLLERHLEVIFLLRKVLQVPVRHLASFLEGSPNVEGWIRTCEQCTELVEECKLVYHQFLEVNSKWLECKSRIVGIIRETGGKEEVVDLEVIDIGKCTRQFVQNHNYKAWRNPYHDGDQKAKELVNLRRLEEEVKHEDGDDVKVEEPDFYILPFPDYYDESVPSHYPSLNEVDIESPEDDLEIKPPEEEAPPPPEMARKVIKRPKKNPGTLKHPTFPRRRGRPRKLAPGETIQGNDHVSEMEMEESVPNVRKKGPGPRNGITKHPTTCPICGIFIRRQEYLKVHLSLLHSIGKLKHACDQCHKTFHSAYKLKRHRKACGTPLSASRSRKPNHLIDTEFRFKCAVANCEFTCENNLGYRNHLRNEHSKEERSALGTCPKIMECLQCSKLLATKEQAKAHLFNHKKAEKDWICEFCGKAFISEGKLNFHKKTNLTCRKIQGLPDMEAKVVCQLCGNWYANRDTLQKHIKQRHEGKLIDLVCPVEGCGRIFHDKPAFRDHQLGVHKLGGKPGYICPECGKGFYTSRSRTNHRRGVHRGGYKTDMKKKPKVKNQDV